VGCGVWDVVGGRGYAGCGRGYVGCGMWDVVGVMGIDALCILLGRRRVNSHLQRYGVCVLRY